MFVSAYGASVASTMLVGMPICSSRYFCRSKVIIADFGFLSDHHIRFIMEKCQISGALKIIIFWVVIVINLDVFIHLWNSFVPLILNAMLNYSVTLGMANLWSPKIFELVECCKVILTDMLDCLCFANLNALLLHFVLTCTKFRESVQLLLPLLWMEY